MFSHVTLGVSGFDRALAFYRPFTAALDLIEKFCEPDVPGQQWAGYMAQGAARPLFIIATPFDGAPARPGNGAMVCFLAPDRATVDRVHRLALELGGTDEGPPGPRPWYHRHYYGAYFRDPDGNKLAVAYHGAAAG